jgi:hypothetical protein
MIIFGREPLNLPETTESSHIFVSCQIEKFGCVVHQWRHTIAIARLKLFRFFFLIQLTKKKKKKKKKVYLDCDRDAVPLAAERGLISTFDAFANDQFSN